MNQNRVSIMQILILNIGSDQFETLQENLGAKLT